MSRRTYLYIGAGAVLLVIGLAVSMNRQTTDSAPDVLGSISSEEVLVSVESVGGLCTYGPCSSEIELYGDGRWTYVDGAGGSETGTLSASRISPLSDRIRNTSFTDVKSHPFTGTCPTAFDEQKDVYTFNTASGLVTVDSCETDVAGQALFEHIDTLRNVIYATFN